MHHILESAIDFYGQPDVASVVIAADHRGSEKQDHKADFRLIRGCFAETTPLTPENQGNFGPKG